jgi:murein DD-endopeptidase MepM/ murein hydrolase activator NlpD
VTRVRPGRGGWARQGSVLLFCVLILAGSTPAVALDTRSELEKVRSQLAEVDRRIKDAHTEASQIGRQVTAARAEMDAAYAIFADAQARYQEAVRQVEATELRLSNLRGEQAVLEAALARTEIDLRQAKQKLESQAVIMYMQAAAMPSVQFLAGNSIAEAATALTYAGAVYQTTDDAFAGFQILQQEEERQRAAVEQRRQETEVELARLEQERAELESDRDEADRALAEARRQAAAVENLLREINAEIAAAEEHKEGLEADAARLEKEIASRQSSGGTAPGRLGRPVPGRIASPFGFRVHPILGVRRMHTGVDLDAATGDPIHAAEDGKVILAQTYGGYGNAVVIDHGGGMATLYAHQSKLGVTVGQVVKRGEVIGYIGCTGLCTGPHLHFEVRINGGFVDPVPFF